MDRSGLYSDSDHYPNQNSITLRSHPTKNSKSELLLFVHVKLYSKSPIRIPIQTPNQNLREREREKSRRNLNRQPPKQKSSLFQSFTFLFPFPVLSFSFCYLQLWNRDRREEEIWVSFLTGLRTGV